MPPPQGVWDVLGQFFSNCDMPGNHPGILVWGGAWNSALLTSSLVMSMLLINRLHWRSKGFRGKQKIVINKKNTRSCMTGRRGRDCSNQKIKQEWGI